MAPPALSHAPCGRLLGVLQYWLWRDAEPVADPRDEHGDWSDCVGDVHANGKLLPGGGGAANNARGGAPLLGHASFLCAGDPCCAGLLVR
jgi:hypothetical protein